MTFQVSLSFLVFIWRSCERFPSLDTFKESWAAGNLRGLRTRSYLRNHICKPWVCWWQQCWRCWRGGGRGWRGGPSDLQSRPSGSGMTSRIRWQTDLDGGQTILPAKWYWWSGVWNGMEKECDLCWMAAINISYNDKRVNSPDGMK